MNKNIRIFILLLFLASVFSGCKGGDAVSLEKNSLERLMDHFRKSSLTQTPYSGLTDHFETAEETLSADMIMIRPLSNSRQKVWAATTQYAILGYNESVKPPEMEISQDGQPLPFYLEGDEQSVSWKWINTGRNFDLRFDGRYNKARKCLVLGTDAAYDFEAFLPEGPGTLEILAERNRPAAGLEISMNGRILSLEQVAASPSLIRLDLEKNPGLHSFTIRTVSEKETEPLPAASKVSIYSIALKTTNDVVLFFVPASKQKTFAAADIGSRYPYSSAGQNRFASLFRIQKDFMLHSFSHPENPYGLKKKLEVDNSSIDVLLAPPSSMYTFEVKIPEQAFLEFGTGIFLYPHDFQEKAVRFHISATAEDITDILYERKLISSGKMSWEELEPQNIDLSHYAGRTIRLDFQTEPAGGSPIDEERDPAMAYWVNPLVYTPETEGFNVILVSLDTLRADHLGSYGYRRDTSPCLDQLAEEGILFEHVYAQSPWTLPSHMSLLFSLNTASHQVYLHNQSIEPSLPSLASFMKDHGYMTSAFTGGGYMSSIYGFPKGFDRYDEPADDKEPDFRAREAAYLYNTAADWLARNQDKKFFLFLHTFQIHGPYESPPPWNKAFLADSHKWENINLKDTLEKRNGAHSFSSAEIENIIALYDAEIHYTDQIFIKPLLEHLKQLGIYDRTLLIFTSDHGEEFYDHSGWLHGDTLYNEQIQVPLIIKMPYSENGEKRIQAAVRSIDVMPTVLDLAGIKAANIDGKSLLNIIRGQDNKDRVFISDLASRSQPQLIPLKMATNRDNLKFIFTRAESGMKSIETYDLSRDPEEKNNLFPKALTLRDEVLSFLNQYYEKKRQQNQAGKEIQLDRELEEKLKALGYLR